jgi:uncharacterized protein
MKIMKRRIPVFLILSFMFLSGCLVNVSDIVLEGFNAYKNKDYKTAQKIWLPLAENGNYEAQYGLGLMYQNGSGVLKNHKEAIKWYRLAGEQEYLPAQSKVAFLYDKGQGVQDYQNAFKWHQLMAERGNAQAQNDLGYKYEIGEGVQQNYVMAFMWYEVASKRGIKKSIGKKSKIIMKITSEQRAEAQALADEWLRKHEMKKWWGFAKLMFRQAMISWKIEF